MRFFPVNSDANWVSRNRGPALLLGSGVFSCTFPHKMPLAGLGSGIFPANSHTKRLLSHVHVCFHCAGLHRVCFLVLGSVFLLRALICLLSYVLSYVYSHRYAFICMLSYACFHMCAFICALICVISYVCSHMCGVICVLLLCSYLCALLCVLSYVCSPL